MEILWDDDDFEESQGREFVSFDCFKEELVRTASQVENYLRNHFPLIEESECFRRYQMNLRKIS